MKNQNLHTDSLNFWSKAGRLHLALVDLFEKNWGREKNFAILRRLFKIYLHGFPGAADLRHQMMQVNHFDEARAVMAALRVSQQLIVEGKENSL